MSPTSYLLLYPAMWMANIQLFLFLFHEKKEIFLRIYFFNTLMGNLLVLNKNPYSIMILKAQGANSIGAFSRYKVSPCR